MGQFDLDGLSLITPEAIAGEIASQEAGRQNDSFVAATAHLALVLDLAGQNLERLGDPAEAVRRLSEALHETRRRFPAEVWQALIPIAQNHRIADMLLQDPFTRWSFEKPRGYSGDARLLDFIYGHASIAEQVAQSSELGKAIYAYTAQGSPPAVAVRDRRDLVTRSVDEIAGQHTMPIDILTLAAGHLREADRSLALHDGRIARWVALDQDPLSVGSITRDFRGTAVEARDGTVRGLLADAYKLGQFDFVYSAGLYDYLADNVAVRLTQRSVQLLKPGGVLMFANFAKDITDDGYMQSFMNWALLLRSERDMWKIIDASVDRNTVEAKVFFGSNRNIVYAVLTKRT